MTVMFRGLPACECLAKWLPVYERELQETGNLVGTLRIFQLIGDAAASGNTHLPGGAYDVTDGTPSQADVLIGRQMGAAEWLRQPPTFSTLHRHGVLRGCPHNAGGRYQIGALDDGFNGLGKGGRGGPDDGPRNFEVRTWQDGIAWAKKRQRVRAINAKIAQARAEKGEIDVQIDALREQKTTLTKKIEGWIETRDSL